jgi:hypothetical protein
VSSAPSSAPVRGDDEKTGPGRVAAAIILAVLAIAFFVAAVIYATTPADALPGFMGFARTHAIHRLYAVGTGLIGVAFAVAAWFALRYRSLALEEALEAGQADQAGQAALSPEPAFPASAPAARTPDPLEADPRKDARPVDTAQSLCALHARPGRACTREATQCRLPPGARHSRWHRWNRDTLRPRWWRGDRPAKPGSLPDITVISPARAARPED